MRVRGLRDTHADRLLIFANGARTSTMLENLCTVAAIALGHVTVPAAVAAQSVHGAMTVSATVLPPDDAQSPQLISVGIARTGIARLETAAPIAGAVSRIVMVTLSSPTNSFAPVMQAPILVPARRRRAAVSAPGGAPPAPRLSYEVDVGRPPVGPNARAVSVRVSYLVIPGGI